MSHEFTEYLEQEGIIHETSAPQTPQQNRTAERINQTILGGAHAMLHHAGMMLGFWSEAVHVAAHILNCLPRSGLDWKTPYELLFGRKPEVMHIHVFGCRAWAIDDKAEKWDLRSTPMVFVGYEIASKAYRLWNPKTHKIVVSTNVKFDETVLPNKPSIMPAPVVTTTTPLYVPPHKRSTTVDIPWLFVDEEKAKPSTASTSKGKQRVISPPSSSSSSSSSSDSESEVEQPVPPPEPTAPTPPPESPHVSPKTPERTLPSTPPNQGPSQVLPDAPTKSHKSKKQPKQVEKYVAGTSGLGSAETEGDDTKQLEKFERTYCHMVELYTSTSTPNEPKSYEDAKASADASKWVSAMKEEIDTLKKQSTWEVVKQPKDKPVVSCKWVYRMKLNEAGEIIRYKARLVARGFSQTYGVDYKDMFAPVTHLETLRLMFVLAIQQNWEIRQIDVKNTYLYRDLDEEIYMEAAKGMDIPKGKVLHLKKALYSLKQAG